MPINSPKQVTEDELQDGVSHLVAMPAFSSGEQGNLLRLEIITTKISPDSQLGCIWGHKQRILQK